MVGVLLNAFAFILIIIIGRILDAFHVLPANASATLKKILINITLPAAIIINFNKNTLSSGVTMLALALLGLGANIIMIAVGMIATRKRTSADKALYMLCLPSMNIGAFSIPFIQSFLPAAGIVTACMFDVGNSIACTGGTYAFTSQYVTSDENGIDFRAFIKKLVTSTPLMTYIIMFTIVSLGFHLPHEVITLINPMAAANPFIAMMMIGTMIRIDFKREYMTDLLAVIGLRHIFSIALAALCYFVLPLDLIARQALVIISFAPLSIIAPAYTGLCGGDEGKASAINSLTIILSVIEITALLVAMGLN
ncbi:AEC family transporter [Alloscardovia venturai]|uniref:AEC family transporter n=1 Tax=Alloscardovia venturai TaxID=1769421 RepID=A0ABW2Y7W4_9BIFI